ncbi:MAG: hypothetical protein AVO33_06455 [delta proteobacterium ML8_F1]|nr:MAG: hypothetical protein AVO33_06455 [delta proteobacterium ML8_F1]
MAIIEVTVVPLGTGDTSLSKYVADCHRVIEKYNVTWELTPMGTVFEGELSMILKIIREMHEVPFDKGAQRVSTTIRIDDRRDHKATLEQKKKSVMDKLK